MKLLVILAVSCTLLTLTECRHTKGKHHKRHKKSNIAHVSSPASKRQYYSVSPADGCCDHYGYPEPYSCCHLPNSPPCCETVHQPQHAVISTNINCCQTPNAPPCCSRVPEQISLQGCCSSVHPVSPSQPCCIPVEAGTNKQQNISVSNSAGHKFILNVKVIPEGQNTAGGQLCERPCSATPAPATSPTSQPTTASTVGTTASPTISILDVCRERALSEHNTKRAIHNAPAMVLDSYLNSLAESLAKAHLARLQNPDQQEDDFSSKRPWGISVFNISGFNEDDELDCKQVVDAWYDEVKDYSFHAPSYHDLTRHFTQLVWKASTKLGIGIAVSNDKSNAISKKSFGAGRKTYVVVALYVKPGNIDGEFSENVEKGQYGGPVVPHDPCQQSGLEAHNMKRKIHQALPMILDPHLNKNADVLARQLYKTWKPKGSGFHMAGFRGSSNIIAIKMSLLESTPNMDACSMAVDFWYNEVNDYDFNNPEFSEKTQHFTQLVWKSSIKLGMAIAPLDPDYFVVVATYDNGNEEGEFSDNVNQGSYVALSDCEKEIVRVHNEKRPLHFANEVTVDRQLTDDAQKLADVLVKKGEIADTSPYEEKPGTSIKMECEIYADDAHLCRNAAEEWYYEHKNYNFKNPGFQKDARHFTQMVWRGSSSIGVGLAKAEIYRHGAIYKYWSGVKYGRLTSLKSKKDFPNNPQETKDVNEMNYYRGGSYYGQMLSGYFTPKVTGQYQFYETCDDQCELKISPDDNPKNAKQVIYVPSYKNPGSWARPTIPIKMEAGKSYYIEATMTQIGGGQHIKVGVKQPNMPFDGKPIQSDLLLKSPPMTCNTLVIRYKEPGNKDGKFKENVKAKDEPFLSKAVKFIKEKWNKLKSIFS